MTYNKKDNYCSMSPDKLFGVNFNYACYLHDRYYRDEYKVRVTRKQVDKDLRDRIWHRYILADKLKLGWVISRVYYWVVRLFGRKYWK